MSSTIVAAGSTLELSGVIPFETIQINGSQLRPASLALTGNATLDNGGTILLDGSYFLHSLIENGRPDHGAVTLDNVNGTIEGAGIISLSDSVPLSALVNQSGGIIDGNGTGPLVLGLTFPEIVDNAGLIEATGTGGLLIDNSRIDNLIGAAGGTIAAIGAGAIVTLDLVDVSGGTLETAVGGAIIAPVAATTLDGSAGPNTINEWTTIGCTGAFYLELKGRIDNAGALSAGGPSAGHIDIEPGDSVTLAGGGIIGLGAGGAIQTDPNGIGTAPAVLLNINNTIDGAFTIGGNGPGLALTNEAAGQIEATGAAPSTIDLGGAGGPTLVNNGLIESQHVLIVDSPVAGTGRLQVDAGATLALQQGVAAPQSILFGPGSGGRLDVSQALALNGVIENFTVGDTIRLPNVGGCAAEQQVYSAGTLTLSEAGVVQAALRISGPYATGDFRLSADPNGGTDVTACFVRGTHIATTEGPVPVESLHAGMRARTARGALREVVWIGRRMVDCGRHPQPATVQPVRVRAGAFGAGLPSRDLLLSPDHAVFADNVLIPIRYLVNGASIATVRRTSVEYFHVELASHDVILAEGLAVESYLDTGNRAAFTNGASARITNGASALMLFPDFARRSWAHDACAPLVTTGPALAAVKRGLLARLPDLGYRPAPPAEPWLERPGSARRLRPARVRATMRSFLLPAGTEQVILRTPGFVPAGLDATNEDVRALGSCVRSLFVNGRALDLGDPSFGPGFHPPERDGARHWRWSDGAGALRLSAPDRAAPVLLEIGLLERPAGWVRAEGLGADAA